MRPKTPYSPKTETNKCLQIQLMKKKEYAAVEEAEGKER